MQCKQNSQEFSKTIKAYFPKLIFMLTLPVFNDCFTPVCVFYIWGGDELLFVFPCTLSKNIWLDHLFHGGSFLFPQGEIFHLVRGFKLPSAAEQLIFSIILPPNGSVDQLGTYSKRSLLPSCGGRTHYSSALYDAVAGFVYGLV